MEQHTVFVKGMVCRRCEALVENELKDLGYSSIKLSLGEASFTAHDQYNQEELQKRLASHGLSILEDKRLSVVKSVKKLVEEVYGGDYDFPDHFRFAELLRQRVQKDYEPVSDAFIALEKQTIEQYIIGYRINKVKEYLVYTDLTLADIAFKLNFTSVAHLSTQFKQQTGLTPSYFKKIKQEKEETQVSN